MTQPPYGAGPDPYQQPPAQGGYGTPPSGGYAAPPPGVYGAAPQGGVPQMFGPYGAPPPKSRTGLIIAAVVAAVAIAAVIVAVLLVNETPDPSPLVQGDDPALNQMAQSCFDGEMAECDQLYRLSPLGSEYESYGKTCGGRIDEADMLLRLCVDIF